MSAEFITQAALTIFATALLSLLAWLGKSKVERMEKDLEQLQDEMMEFKDNYLDRFEKVNKNITESREQIIEKFHSLEMKLKNG